MTEKRCYHNQEPTEPEPSQSLIQIPSLISTSSGISGFSKRGSVARDRSASPASGQRRDHALQKSRNHETDSSSITEAGQNADYGSESRQFACDSNPMATFMENDGSRLQNGQSQKGDVGAWLSPGENYLDLAEAPNPRLLSRALYPQSTSVDIPLLPPKQSQEALVDVYFRRIHPILPLLDEQTVRVNFKEGCLHAQLLQTICLVAAKDRTTASVLCLGQSSKVLQLERFSSILYSDIMQNMPRTPREKIIYIQILALLSLHEWGPTGSEDRSLNLAQAIHHAHTIGLHLMRIDQQPIASLKALFWCLWSLDKWNAAMSGRPIMIHDRDMNQGVDDVISSFPASFRLWLDIAEKLGRVILFYRPIVNGADHEELDLPSFEEIVEDCGAWDIPSELLESSELLYHAVIILSTHSNGLQGRSRPRASSIRQTHSIFSIASLIHKRDFKCLPPLPMLGYTISLAFSVTYKQLRESQLASTRQTAIKQMREFHQCLIQSFSIWWSTAVMARLGTHVLDRIQASIELQGSTAPVNDALRPNSRQKAGDQRSQNLGETEILGSHPSVDCMQGLGRTETGIERVGPLYIQPRSDDLSDLDISVANPFLGASGIEDFDIFFNNFPDVNFPSGNDQLLLDMDMDMSGFEFE
ncbi:Transcription factor [Penicillium nucicola]|uniref:Transcription factor n=1 Tax=Penicillium nucicola TaxID=1850975 RepID=UPI0025451A46|nr:Transcription factor [Penicillium nucicola]KAJ5766151.1 Transcription factor [Penicillium nucicola]